MARTEFAERLVEFRKRCGWTGKDIAARLGVNHSTYRSWESGTSKPKPADLLKLQSLGFLPDPAVVSETRTPYPITGNKDEVLALLRVIEDQHLPQSMRDDAKAELLAKLGFTW